MKHLKNRLLAASLVSAAGILTTTSKAAIIVEDHFLTGAGQYTAGNVVPQNPAVTGFTGAWVASQQSPDVITTGLSYSGVASSGGALQANSTNGDRAGHVLSSTFTSATTGTFYMSFMLKFSSTNAGTIYRALELYNGGFTDATQRSLQVGLHNDFGNANLGVRVNNTLTLDLGAPDTNTNLFVLKLNFSNTALGDSLTIWRNPTSLDSEAGSTAKGTLSNFDMQFDRMALAAFGAGHTVTGDEFRIGTAWQNVTTVPEPAAALLGGLGLISLLRRRR